MCSNKCLNVTSWGDEGGKKGKEKATKGKTNTLMDIKEITTQRESDKLLHCFSSEKPGSWRKRTNYNLSLNQDGKRPEVRSSIHLDVYKPLYLKELDKWSFSPKLEKKVHNNYAYKQWKIVYEIVIKMKKDLSGQGMKRFERFKQQYKQ